MSPAPHPQLCVSGVAVTDDRLLLIRRGHGPGAGEWSLPGGRVELGELLAAAVVREVAEETGLDVVCGQLLGWTERFDADDHYVVLGFEVVVLDPIEPTAGSDAAEVAWVPLSEVPELRLVEGLAEFLADQDLIELIG